MADIKGQLIKDSYNYVLQADIATGVVYRIGGSVPTNLIFQSGITVNGSFTYSDGSQQNGYVLTCDAFGNASWKPVSGATPSSGVTSITSTNNITGTSTTGNVTIGLSNNITLNSVSATTYYNLPIDVRVTGGTYSANQIVFTNNTGGTFSVTGITASGISANWYGSFTDTGNQPVNGANTATAWTANTTEIANGISIVNNSRITFTNSGIYEVGYSAQIEKTLPGGSPNVTIWAAINGNPVTRSSSTLSLTNQSAYQLPFVSYIFEINAGDYVEFYFSSTDSSVQLTTLSGLTSPTRPVSPSLILVAKSIGNAVLNTSGDSFVTGFSLSNSTLTLTQNRIGQYSGFSVNLPFLPLTGGSVSGAISATTYYGDGSNLTGISRGGGGGAGGQLYYFNISKTQSPYYEFATTATTAAEQTISVTTGGTQTAFIGGFMTPSGYPNITTFPAGILSFYLHAYDDNSSYNFDIYCQLYKRTTGGTETLLFTSDPSPVIGSTVQMIITDGFFSGATLNASDRLVVKVYGQNLTNQTRTISLVSEGSSHYSFALTTIPTFFDTFVTGGTYTNGTITFTNNSGNTFNVTGLAIQGVTGITANNGLSATTSNNVTTIGFSGGNISNSTNFTNGLTANTFVVGTTPSLYTTTSTTVSTGTNTIYSVSNTLYNSIFIDYSLSGSTGKRAGTIVGVWDGSSIEYNETSTKDIGDTSSVTFSLALNSTADLIATITSSTWLVKTIIKSI